MKKPELLSPVGSFESLDAAIAGGADAVYFGGSAFSARAFAGKFAASDLAKLIDKAHSAGVKAYIALNTLLTDRELNEAISVAAEAYELGTDAAIVTDYGLISYLRRFLPDFELHASTQAGAHNPLFSEYAKEHGISRVVLARECSLDEIRRFCKESALPVEVFVHGALCVCHSGQCLLSSVIGGRSGNRGECAQPCRMKYGGSYPLSLRDLCAAGHITELIECGVDSLKIEGRMKSPDYVYSTTALYRTLIDEGRNATESEIARSEKIFSRSGFTDGYLVGKIDSEMLGTRTDDDKRNSRRANVEMKKVGEPKKPIVASARKAAMLRGDEIKKETRVKKNRSKKLRQAYFLSPEKMPQDLSYFDIIYLPLDRYDKRANGVILPPVIFGEDTGKIKKELALAIEKGARHLLCHQPWHADFARLAAAKLSSEVKLHGSMRLGVCGNASVSALADCGFSDITLSPEITLPAMRDIGYKKAVIVYGRLPVMTLQKPVGKSKLVDRTGAVFPIAHEWNTDLLFNSVPIYEGDRMEELEGTGIENTVFIFTTEDKNTVTEIIEKFRRGEKYSGKFTRIKKQR